jgi:mRNA interferase RelE/StbE
LSYRIELTNAASKELKRLQKRIQPRIMKSIGERISALAKDPRPPSVEKIEGEDNLWRVRAGKDYRIVYTIKDEVLLVVIVRIGHRREVYRRR